MTAVDTFLLFKLILLTGLGGWMAVVVVNNVIEFARGVTSVGGLMNMELFDLEPSIESPLLVRRVAAVFWHRVVYVFVLLLEAAAAASLCLASVGFGARS